MSQTFSDGIAHIEACVQSRLNGRIRNLRIEVSDQGLVLRGHTETYHAKQLAQHAVLEACELPILANEIEVICRIPIGCVLDALDQPMS